MNERQAQINLDFNNFCEQNGIINHPVKSKFLTEKYISYLTKEYQFQFFHVAFIKFLAEHFDLEGKTVLEIGGSNFPTEIVMNIFKVKKWVCVDTPYWNESSNPRQYREIKQFEFSTTKLGDALKLHDYILYRGYTDHITPDFANKFDFVFSLACLEHVQNMLYALNVIYDCLKCNGVFYTHLGPLWSSQYGSHFFITDTPRPFESLTCLNPLFLPPFVHLTHSRKDIYLILLEKIGEHPKLEQWASEIKGDSSFVNRYFYEDYKYFLEHSKFENKIISPYKLYLIDSQTKEKLCEMHKGYEEFDVESAIIMAIKETWSKGKITPIPQTDQHSILLNSFESVPTRLLLKKLVKRIVPRRIYTMMHNIKNKLKK